MKIWHFVVTIRDCGHAVGRRFKLLHLVLTVLALCRAASAANLTFDGNTTYQTIEGLGVNVNYRSWDGTNLQAVLDAFLDQAGMTSFRVVYDLTNWETNNDNADPDSMDWTYYNTLYSSTEFTRLWDMFEYLNSRGVTNGAFFNFMGWGPTWMMDSGGLTLEAGMEGEWAEMLASALVYARKTRGLQFGLVAPNNEPDWSKEGIHMAVGAYTNALHQLALKLDTNGLSDVRFIGPDLSASGGTGYMPEMMADPVVMAKLKHFGVHNYSAGGWPSADVLSFIEGSAYPDRTCWVTEFSVSSCCSGCDNGTKGTYTWSCALETAEYLLSHLLNGASGGQVWEGYDSIYAHHGDAWSYWGLFGVDDIDATAKTYTPRKHFYTMAQISKWVRPGAQRIRVSGTTSPFSPVLAFKHTGLGQVTVVGINTSSNPAVLDGMLASLPAVPHLELYYTSATTNLASGGSVPVSNGTFSATIPADCLFTLAGFTPAPLGVTTTNLPSAEVGVTYAFPLAASGGSPPYFWGVASNAAAPPGLSLSTNGVLSGVPTTAGQFNFPVAVTDSTTSGVATVALTVSNRPFVITSITVSNDLARVRWNSETGTWYRVQYKNSLTAMTWNDMTPDVLATGLSADITDFVVGVPQRFYRARLAPMAPVILSASWSNDLATVTWTAIAGMTYQVQYKTNLDNGSWTHWVTDVSATGPVASVTNAVPAATQYFFRVIYLGN